MSAAEQKPSPLPIVPVLLGWDESGYPVYSDDFEGSDGSDG